MRWRCRPTAARWPRRAGPAGTTERSACIYLLDAETGELRGKIAGLPEVVATLRFSPDGKHLAAGMMGTAGLAVFRVRDRAACG